LIGRLLEEEAMALGLGAVARSEERWVGFGDLAIR
jgi:hypothetical protein